MFDINDHETIMKLIHTKKSDAYLVPLYVKINKDTFSLTELNSVKTFSSSFRVGFGAIVSIFDRYSYPEICMFNHDCVTAFSEYNEDKQVDEKYIVIESGYIDINDDDKTQVKQVKEQINYYYEMLYQYINERYQKYRKKLIQDMMDSQTFSS